MPASDETLAVLPVEDVRVGAFTIPTDAPESDSSLEWDATTLVVVGIAASGLPRVRTADAATLLIADGFSCREQIAQTAARRALHLAHVLDLARGEPGQK